MKILSKIQLLKKFRYAFSIFITHSLHRKFIVMHYSLSTQLKILLIVLFFSSFSNKMYAQENPDNDSNFWKHIRFGGGIGLNFGNGFFSGTLAPSALYEINEFVGVGLGLNGTYSSVKDNRNGEDFKASILGGNIFTVFNPVDGLQLSVDFEELHVNRTLEFDGGNVKESYWVPALFLGAGYRTNNVTFGIRYDVIYNQDRSIYANAWMPFIRVFF